MSNNYHIKYKLVFTVLVILITIVSTISIYSYNIVSEQTLKNKFEHLSSLQKNKILELNMWFDNLNKLLVSLADQKNTKESFIALEKNFNLAKKNKTNTYDKIYEEVFYSNDKFLKAYNIYDIFMIDLSGNIIYTNIKEADFKTNLIFGPFKNSGLANIFKEAKNIKKGEIIFEDLKPYKPSFDNLASFIATPIFHNNKLIGVFSFQLSIDYINKILHYNKEYSEVGLGNSGETFLVGEDLKLRSNLREHNNEDQTIINISNAQSDLIKPAVKELGNKSKIIKNYKNQEVLSVAEKITFANLDWYIVTQMGKKEILQSTNILRDKIAFISLFLLSLSSILILIYINRVMTTLSKKEKELKEKNSLLNILMQNIPIPMFYKDNKGVYTDINPKFTEVFGVEKNEMIGKTVHDIADKELADTYKHYDDILLNSSQDKVQIYESQVANKKTAEIKSVIFHKSLYFDADSKPLGIIGAVLDITEFKKIHKELEELNNNLEKKVSQELEKNLKKEVQLFESAKLAAMGSMIGNIIHQWRQPLSLISTISSGLSFQTKLSQSISNEKIQKDMAQIANSIERLTSVTDTFRNFLKEKKEIKTIDLKEGLNQALVISGTVIKDNGITLINNINKKEEIIIKTIPNELTEVIINIVNNAIDAINENNIQDGLITITLKKEEKFALIYIEDNAGGVPKNIIDNIFNEYFTTKSEGTGLGLYMSKKIVTESLKGKLLCQNEELGAKFCIKLPIETS